MSELQLRRKSVVTGWSKESRAAMQSALKWTDFSPLFSAGNKPVSLTLKSPERHWQQVFPEPARFKGAIDRFVRDFTHSWELPMIGVWKLEFGEAGTPRLHILTRTIAGHRPLPSTGASLGFEQWVSQAWPDAVGVGRLAGPDARAAFVEHLRNGTQIDYPSRYYADPERIATFFIKQGTGASYRVSQAMPGIWVEAVNAGARSTHLRGNWLLQAKRSRHQFRGVQKTRNLT